MLRRTVSICLICLLPQLIIGQKISFSEAIKEARTSSDNRSVQIMNLLALEDTISAIQYRDTLGLLYYAIAFRYRVLGNNEQQFNYAQKATREFEKSKYTDYQYPFVLSFLGEGFQALNRQDSALYIFDKLSKLDLKGRGQTIYGYAQSKKAEIYRLRKDYQTAINILDYCLITEKKKWLSDNDLIEIYLENSICNAFLSKENNLLIANKHLKEAKNILQRENNYYPEKHVELLMQEGLIELYNNELSKAERAYNTALKLTLSDQSKGNNEATRIAYNIAKIYLNQNKGVEALHHSKKAYQLFSNFGDPEQLETESILYINLSEAYLQNNQIDSALHYANKGIDLFDHEQYVHSGYDQYFLNLLYRKTECQFATYRSHKNEDELLKAQATILEIDRLFDSFIDTQLSETSIYKIKEDGNKYYELGIEIAFHSQDSKAFWYLTEKAKALSILKAHLKKSLEVRPVEDTQRKRQLSRLNYILSSQQLTDKKRDSLENQLVLLKNTLFEQAKNSRKVTRSNFPISTLESASRIYNDWLILQFKFGPNDLFAVALINGHSTIHRLGNKKELKKSIIEFRSLVGDPDSDFEELIKNSERLYRILMQPISLDNQNILIIPDEELFLLPFDALSSTNNKPSFLAEKHLISYAPSASLMEYLEESSSSSYLNHVMVPNYNESDTYASLPFATAESQELVEKFNGRKISDTTALLKQEVVQALQISNIFHFAGHAVANKTSAYLALSSHTDVSDKLLLEEIYSINNSANLVILSACNTGYGKVISGEGIASLSRGFLYSGARSVISTLWTVDDKSTSEIIQQFYKHLHNGEPKGASLFEAKRSFVRNAASFQKHPYYWAGITLTGHHAKVNLSNQWAYKLFIFFASIIIIVFLVKSLNQNT